MYKCKHLEQYESFFKIKITINLYYKQVRYWLRTFNNFLGLKFENANEKLSQGFLDK